MMNNYIKGALMLGVAALCGSSAMADGYWRNLNNEVLEYPAFIKGWSGAVSVADNNVAEAWNGGIELYQVLNDMPAGDYTLSISGFYRNWNDPNETNNAWVFINDNKVQMAYYNTEDVVPGGRAEANEAFQAGKFVNTVSCTLSEEGPLTIGVISTGGYVDEWTCFGNVKLQGPDGDMTDRIVNADFSSDFNPGDNDAVDVWWDQVFTPTRWNPYNYENAVKMPQLNLAGALYSKCNCAGWNYGQVVDLEPGTYRLSIQGLYCPGVDANHSGWGVDYKSPFATPAEKETALDRHNNGNEGLFPVIYFTSGGIFDGEDSEQYKSLDLEDALLDNENAFYVEANLPCIFDEEMDDYIDIVNDYPFDVVDQIADEGERMAAYANATGHQDQNNGHFDEVISYFLNNPQSYRVSVEVEVPEATKAWVGVKRDTGNSDASRQWTCFRDFKLERWTEKNTQGISSIANDAEATPEYYTIQGIRVAQPTQGVYIVKQGSKVTKQVIR
ncbi:MAG: hypothetical protein LUD17_14110 [Bacteroidales bacterium]|nr:hypothetical protein [Bacteroidales bacterium]